MKLFVYPTGGASPDTLNPYVLNMKESFSNYFELIHPRIKSKIPRMLVFLLNSFKADVYFFNWIEDSAAGRGGLLGAVMSYVGLWILKLRRAKIVWVFHNIHSHAGETFWSKRFRNFLFVNSTFILCHSKEAKQYVTKKASCPVYFKNHPMKRVDYGQWEGRIPKIDFFYWSKILPYKGVVEFLKNPLCQESEKNIYILGECGDKKVDEELTALAVGNVVYENRAADFCEIAAKCKQSKYVIFPYIGDSISSSGVLMDTLLMGGVPVGPNRGAFADLCEQGCCITYNSINEIFNYPTDEAHRIRLDPAKVEDFINNNTWDSFGKWILSKMNNI